MGRIRVGEDARKKLRAESYPSFNFVSSISISLNSLDSKTSPHSRHSTNSASSSRATMRTRGCLHCFTSGLFSEDCGGRDWVIDSGLVAQARVAPSRICAGIGGIFSRKVVVVKQRMQNWQVHKVR